MQAKKKGFQKESVVDAKMNVDKYSELKFRRDALLGMCSPWACYNLNQSRLVSLLSPSIPSYDDNDDADADDADDDW